MLPGFAGIFPLSLWI